MAFKDYATKDGYDVQDADQLYFALSINQGGIIRACMYPNAKSGDFRDPQRYTGYPDLLPPEDLLLDPENICINWEGDAK